MTTLCSDLTEVFFSEHVDDREYAKMLCHHCEVRRACAQRTLAFIEQEGWASLGSGVWAGVSVRPTDAYRLRQRKISFLQAAVFYRHVQTQPALTWSVIHRLPFQPNVTVVDTTRTKIYPDIEYLTEDTVRIRFSQAMTGEAYCS